MMKINFLNIEHLIFFSNVIVYDDKTTKSYPFQSGIILNFMCACFFLESIFILFRQQMNNEKFTLEFI
jgi:hypothetical protein